MSTAARVRPCPCGRGGLFGHCCGRYLDDLTTPAPDAESLMRSRYTAFALGRREHLLATWHAPHRPARLDLDPEISWLGLEVLDAPAAVGEHAEVEFVARFRVRGPGAVEQRLHERSRFVREGGRWFYCDGVTP